jgi:hypothetical protein
VEGIGGGHHQRVALEFHRQDVEARRIAGRHHVGDLGEVDLQRIDAQEGQADLGRAPFAQHVQGQQLVRRLCRDDLALGDGGQRMHGADRTLEDALGLGEVRLDRRFLDDAVGQQPREDGLQVERRGTRDRGGWGQGRHGGVGVRPGRDALDPGLGGQLGRGHDLRGARGQAFGVEVGLVLEAQRDHVAVVDLGQADHVSKAKRIALMFF